MHRPLTRLVSPYLPVLIAMPYDESLFFSVVVVVVVVVVVIVVVVNVCRNLGTTPHPAAIVTVTSRTTGNARTASRRHVGTLQVVFVDLLLLTHVLCQFGPWSSALGAVIVCCVL